jgi:hypothetical protein
MERERLEHEKLVREKVVDEHRSKRARVQSKTNAPSQPQSEPIPPADPTMPNVPRSDATQTPPTPSPLPTAEEDSPVHGDLGEYGLNSSQCWEL